MAVSNEQVLEEVRRLREELRTSFSGGADQLVEAGLNRLRLEGYKSSILRNFSPAFVSSLGQRIFDHRTAEAERWLRAEHGVHLSHTTLYRFASELRAAIEAEQRGEPLNHRNRSGEGSSRR